MKQERKCRSGSEDFACQKGKKAWPAQLRQVWMTLDKAKCISQSPGF